MRGALLQRRDQAHRHAGRESQAQTLKTSVHKLVHSVMHDYYHFLLLIEGVNRTYNIFYGEEETQEFEFLVHDEMETIEKFKLLCQPGNEPESKV